MSQRTNSAPYSIIIIRVYRQSRHKIIKGMHKFNASGIFVQSSTSSTKVPTQLYITNFHIYIYIPVCAIYIVNFEILQYFTLFFKHYLYLRIFYIFMYIYTIIVHTCIRKSKFKSLVCAYICWFM